MLPALRVFGAFNEMAFGPVVLIAGTRGSLWGVLSEQEASLLPVPALHFNEGLFC